MSLENGSLNSIPFQSLESLKEIYKQRLNNILNKQLTVENIEIFADEALSETIQLTDEILAQYRDNPEFHGDTALNTQKQEDEAFKLLGLPNLQEVLQSIIDVRDKIATLKEYINTNTKNIDEVITPPQPDWQTEINGGSGKGIEKKIFPRLLTLLYILEHDFDIAPSEVLITEGIVTPNMMRQTPYVRVEISELERIMYICDEEGNASYIFDTTKLEERGLTLEEIDVDDKGDKNSLIAHYPGIGIRLVQSNAWRTHVASALRDPIPEIQTDVEAREEREDRKNVSEFGKERKKLSFEDFQDEVRELYPGKGGAQEWYHKESKKHPNWFSNPNKSYKDKGWIGWAELVGRENSNVKEFLSFDDFSEEVKKIYPGGESIHLWYMKEQRNHENWPSNPERTYRNGGWIGWSELVGKERRYKDYAPFSDFQDEVRGLYNGEVDIERWYLSEFSKHPHWPSKPYVTYKDKGWAGFPELVGVENRKKKEFLSFENFQDEVKSLYPGKGNVSLWYREEQKDHPNWPTKPERIYKNKGWIGFPELVGIENFRGKEYPSFADFQNEVRNFYKGEKNIILWYSREYKNHRDWPSNPDKEYKNNGWVGYPELVGIENFLKKNFLSFEDFQSQVMEVYKGEKNVQDWYREEVKNHSNWPHDPNKKYRDKGWISFPELVGKENRIKKK